jgi:hypothetical protein
MCGVVAKHVGDVDLAAVGKSDWTHYGLGGAVHAVNRKCDVTPLIHPLVMNGPSDTFDNCPQTFSWSKGGFEPGAPAAAQVGSVHQTPAAIYSTGGSKGGGFNFTVDIPSVPSTTRVYLYLGTCANVGSLDVALVDVGTGKVEKTFGFTMNAAEAKTCQWTGVATITIPPPSGSPATIASSSSSTSAASGLPRLRDMQGRVGARTLTGSWIKSAAHPPGERTSGNENIQFHAIAVDAGGPVAAGSAGSGTVTSCANSGGGGSVILQAAVLSENY